MSFTTPTHTLTIDLPAIDHRNLPLNPESKFFQPPPSDIGEIVSSHSTLNPRRHPFSPMARSTIIALTAAPGIFLLFYRNPSIAVDSFPWILLGSILLAFGIPLAWFFTRFKAVCSYVGTDGAVRFTSRDRVGKNLTTEKIIFKHASALYVARDDYRVGHAYRYRWVDIDGRAVCRIKGAFTSRLRLPPDDPVHFVHAAEAAWTKFALSRAEAEIERTGSLRFPLGRNRCILLAPDLFELSINSTTRRYQAADLESFSLANGLLRIIRRNGKWLDFAGTFPLSLIPNAELFSLALRRFFPGVPWQTGWTSMS